MAGRLKFNVFLLESEINTEFDVSFNEEGRISINYIGITLKNKE